MRSALLIALLATSAPGDERAVFYGSWGTPEQCSRLPITPGGTVLAEPFEIDAQWLGHGQLWCRLNWLPIEPRENGYFSGAQAACGEDAVRGHFLGMRLSGDQLTLTWNFGLINGPLKRCTGERSVE